MEHELHTYKLFYNVEQAYELVEVLEENRIRYQIEQLTSNLNPSFIGSPTNEMQYLIKLLPDDFEKANLMIQHAENINPDNIDKDLPILQFSNEELYEIINKQDEWSPLDLQMAVFILKQRGQNVDDKFVEEAKKKRIENLSLPKIAPDYLIVLGYLTAVIIWIIGFLIGYYLFKSNKTLPNGKIVFEFDNESRKKGKNMMILSIIMLIITLLFWFNREIFIQGFHIAKIF